jgi:hypothetical protein
MGFGVAMAKPCYRHLSDEEREPLNLGLAQGSFRTMRPTMPPASPVTYRDGDRSQPEVQVGTGTTIGTAAPQDKPAHSVIGSQVVALMGGNYVVGESGRAPK